MTIKSYVINGVTIFDHSENAQIADDNVKNQRLNICENCEFKSNDVCSQCNCLLPVKVSILTNSCPIGKW